MRERFNKFLNTGMNKGLSWTTIASEKLLLALIGISTCIASAMYLYEMILQREILLGDLFMLFIYAEILAMVGAFYSTNRIPVTLPIIVAITALCRLIIMQTKEMDAIMVMWGGRCNFYSCRFSLSNEPQRQNKSREIKTVGRITYK